MELFFNVCIYILLAINFWIWYGFIRYILAFLTFVYADVDYTLNSKNLTKAYLYDIFLDLYTWRPSQRAIAINERAKKYGSI